MKSHYECLIVIATLTGLGRCRYHQTVIAIEVENVREGEDVREMWE